MRNIHKGKMEDTQISKRRCRRRLHHSSSNTRVSLRTVSSNTVGQYSSRRADTRVPMLPHRDRPHLRPRIRANISHPKRTIPGTMLNRPSNPKAKYPSTTLKTTPV